MYLSFLFRFSIIYLPFIFHLSIISLSFLQGILTLRVLRFLMHFFSFCMILHSLPEAVSQNFPSTIRALCMGSAAAPLLKSPSSGRDHPSKVRTERSLRHYSCSSISGEDPSASHFSSVSCRSCGPPTGWVHSTTSHNAYNRQRHPHLQ